MLSINIGAIYAHPSTSAIDWAVGLGDRRAPTGHKSPHETVGAGELIQPADKITWILDGKQPRKSSIWNSTKKTIGRISALIA